MRHWTVMLGEVNDDFGFGWRTDISNKYKLVNTDEFDLRPKKEYIEKQLAALEEELRMTQRTKDIAMQRYLDEEKRIQGRIEEKRKELKKL